MTQRDDLVRLALGEVGQPYAKHRDCSGLTAWLYRQIGITIPEGSVAQYWAGTKVSPHEIVAGKYLPGDLLFWDTFGQPPGHVALYVGNGQVVHALNDQKGIVVSRVEANMGGPSMGARRILVPSDSPVEDEPDPVEESWTASSGTTTPSAPHEPSGASSSPTSNPTHNKEDRTPSGKARRRKHRRRKDRA